MQMCPASHAEIAPCRHRLLCRSSGRSRTGSSFRTASVRLSINCHYWSSSRSQTGPALSCRLQACSQVQVGEPPLAPGSLPATALERTPGCTRRPHAFAFAASREQVAGAQALGLEVQVVRGDRADIWREIRGDDGEGAVKCGRDEAGYGGAHVGGRLGEGVEDEE